MRKPWLAHADLEVIVKSGALEGQARVLDLKDHERALVWINGRLTAVCGPSLYALWTVFDEVRVEVVDARAVRFEHPELAVILTTATAAQRLEAADVPAGWVGLAFLNGRLAATLSPGVHAFWRGEGAVKIVQVDLREQASDVAGQEIMTADKVTLRLNAVVSWRSWKRSPRRRTSPWSSATAASPSAS